MFIFDAILLCFMRRRQASQLAAQQAVISRKTKAKFKASPSSDNLAAPLMDSEEASTGRGGAGSQVEDGGKEGGGTGTGHMFSSDSSTQYLVRGFTRARGRIFSLDFTFDKLGLILPNGNPILQSVSARVAPGCVTAIMGPSGAGKTTLLNTLMGKQPAVFKQTGELRINVSGAYGVFFGIGASS
jgi:ABC-type multidrug transport system fused ATPase/permease subunit